MDYSIRIGGGAGQGIETVGEILSNAFAGAGYHVFTHHDYESRVRGGHNFFQVRVASRRVTSSMERVDIVVALDREGIRRHRDGLTKGGVLLYDPEALGEGHEGPSFLGVPFKSLAVEGGGSPVMANTVATGAVMGIIGMEPGILEGPLRGMFEKKGVEVVEKNLMAARSGYEYAKTRCGKRCFEPSAGTGKKMPLLSGLEAAALGALASGMKFYAAYPMTPSTGIMNAIAARAGEYGVIVEQAEDEIAAINMALGASFAGVRAATGSSGGGFALMAEGLSLAGITETPVVIFVAQRPGPATGLPTRTEQGDLLFALHAGHGEFPVAAFAPGTPEQTVLLTNKAFELAEKYQIPALVLLDQYLGDSRWTCEGIDPDRLVYNDYRVRGGGVNRAGDYKRHAFTESGVSPLAVPGEGPYVVVTDSDEHDEEGHITEDGGIRARMVQKRMLGKLEAIRGEMAPPELYGSKAPEIVLAGWGSTYGVLREAVEAMNSEGIPSAMLFFSEIYPLPVGGYTGVLEGAKRAVCVENNATGQLARLIRMETGFSFRERINRYDGRPFSVERVLGAMNVYD